MLADADLVITSYGSIARVPWLALVILDEAQAIKSPAAKQTKAVKALKADTRIALTGTPIENRLGDLWSIFDFINPGLLGSSKQFSGFVKKLADRPRNPYRPLRELVRPYILRRLKTSPTCPTRPRSTWSINERGANSQEPPDPSEGSAGIGKEQLAAPQG
jgi:SNF2 family DNA or RNA helicase